MSAKGSILFVKKILVTIFYKVFKYYEIGEYCPNKNKPEVKSIFQKTNTSKFANLYH